MLVYKKNLHHSNSNVDLHRPHVGDVLVTYLNNINFLS